MSDSGSSIGVHPRTSAVQKLLCPPPPSDFPAVQIKAQPEDFIVEELPFYEPCGTGTHTYFWIEKRGIATHEMVRRVASALGKRALDAGVAGLKDAQSVSRQWISFEHVKQDPAELASLGDGNFSVLKVSAHGNKLKMGHLRGNRFVILLRLARAAVEEAQGSGDLVLKRSCDVLEMLKKCGIPNCFGAQRFGNTGENAALGRMLVKGDTDGFTALYKETCGTRRPADRKLRNLLVNAFQSELFNRVLALRMPEIGRLQAGDAAWLHRNGAVFKIDSDESATHEQPRADAHEISPSGPIFGPKMLAADGGPGEIERGVLAEAGVTGADFGRTEAERQPGARRPLRIFFVEEPSAEAAPDGVLLKFALPSGAYATVVLNEVTGCWK